MKVPQTFGERFFVAWKRKEIADLEPYSAREIGMWLFVEADLERAPPPATVHGWLTGARPDRHIVKAIARVLGCDFEWLNSGREGASGLPMERAEGRMGHRVGGSEDETGGDDRRRPA